MKEFLSGLFIAGMIVGLHFVAELIATYLPWLTILLLAWVFGGIVLALTNELGITKIDLSNLRK